MNQLQVKFGGGLRMFNIKEKLDDLKYKNEKLNKQLTSIRFRVGDLKKFEFDTDYISTDSNEESGHLKELEMSWNNLILFYQYEIKKIEVKIEKNNYYIKFLENIKVKKEMSILDPLLL